MDPKENDLAFGKEAKLELDLKVGDTEIKKNIGLNLDGKTHFRQNGLSGSVDELSYDFLVEEGRLNHIDIHTWNEEGKRIQLVLLEGPYENGAIFHEEKEVEIKGKLVPVKADFAFKIL